MSASAVKAALGVLDALEQGPVLFAAQKLVHFLPHRRAQPRRRGTGALAAPASASGLASAFPG